MSTSRYLISYDICDPKRLRAVARISQKYGHRVQYSIFECSLTGVMLAKLKLELSNVIRPSEDQIMFILLGTTERAADIDIETLGIPYLKRTLVTIV
jgi:CRISPR-associated protein Cas2